MNGKTGHRTVTPNSLRGEKLALTYSGLPEGVTYHQALKLIRRYINGTPDLSRRAKLLMLALLQLQAKAILANDENTGTAMADFTVFARNETLEEMLCMARRTIQKALGELRDRLLVWCNDAPDRNRSRSHGINLLPAFARISELAATEAERSGLRASIKAIQRQYATLKISLEGMRLPVLGSISSEVDDLIRTCDLARRSKDGTYGIERLIELTRTVEDLKSRALADAENHEQESPRDDSDDAPLTNNQKIISKDVGNIRSSLAEKSPSLTSAMTSRSGVLGPDPEALLLTAQAAFVARGLPLSEPTRLPPSARLKVYANVAAAQIRLKGSLVSLLQQRFGEIGASYLLIQAALDPDLRNRSGWVRAFLGDDFVGKIVDTRPSYFRWRGLLDSAAP